MKRKVKTISYATCLMILLQISLFAQSVEFEAGMKATQAGDFQKAIVYFQKSLDDNLPAPKRAQIHYNIGVCYYQLNQIGKAIIKYKQAVLLKPDYEKAFYALGMAYSDMQNWTPAERAFQKVIKLAGGRDGEAWFDLAFVYANKEKYDLALESFQKAVEYKSTATAASHNNIGVIYAIKGDLQSAFREIERAKTLGYSEAEDNLKYLSEFASKGDKTTISKLIVRK